MKAKTKGLESVNTFIFINFSSWATHVEGICPSVPSRNSSPVKPC